MRILCLLFFLLFVHTTNAQLTQPGDTVVVRKDARIDLLIDRQVAINKINARRGANGLFKGFRLQVLNTRIREEAFKTKSDLLMRFPDQKSYVVFQSPFFRIRFGNFISRAEAEDYKKMLSSLYPQGIYVVPDMVEYKLTENDLMTGELKQ